MKITKSVKCVGCGALMFTIMLAEVSPMSCNECEDKKSPHNEEVKYEAIVIPQGSFLVGSTSLVGIIRR